MSEPALQLSATPDALIDEGLAGTRLRGAGAQPDAVWRAKHHDDDGRVWRAIAPSAAALSAAWVPAKSSTGHLAALVSLRPVEIEVRVELPDGRALARTVTRRLLAEGTIARRWRGDGLAATLYRPPGDQPRPTVLLDATHDAEALAGATLAAALLASRGVIALVVGPPARPKDGPPDAARERATERLALVPGADATGIRTLAVPSAESDADALDTLAPATFAPVPPGIGVRGTGAGPEAAAARAAAWDALLAALGATARGG